MPTGIAFKSSETPSASARARQAAAGRRTWGRALSRERAHVYRIDELSQCGRCSVRPRTYSRRFPLAIDGIEWVIVAVRAGSTFGHARWVRDIATMRQRRRDSLLQQWAAGREVGGREIDKRKWDEGRNRASQSAHLCGSSESGDGQSASKAARGRARSSCIWRFAAEFMRAMARTGSGRGRLFSRSALRTG